MDQDAGRAAPYIDKRGKGLLEGASPAALPDLS